MAEITWVKIDPAKFSHPRSELVRGLGINVLISPHDVPEEVAGYYDDNRKRFVIEFNYIGSEPIKYEAGDQFVTACVGKNSGRIYGFEVDVDSLNASAVKLGVATQQVPDLLEGTIARLRLNPNRKNRLENYSVAESVLKEEGGTLMLNLQKVRR